MGPSSRDAEPGPLLACGVDFVLVDDVPFALDVARRAGIEPIPRDGAAAQGR